METFQVSIRNLANGGLIEVAHLHELPSGTLNPDTGKQWTLRDATAADLVSISVPKFAEMEDLIEDVDGYGYQFQGYTNAGRVARSASSAIAVSRKINICVPDHGKNHADHEGFTMAENVKELTLSSEAPVLSGSRSVVLALAQFRPEPTQTHESKDSPWAPKEVVYAFYDEPLLERCHQQFTPYMNSKFYHARIGMQKDARTAETFGTLNMDRVHCACSRCKAPIYDYQNCLVKNIAGASTKK